MIAHLAGRERALEPFGWTGHRAEWIAFACLHSGVFTRAQWSRFLDAHPEQVRRGVHALIAQGAATEETVPGIKGIGRVCRIFSRRILPGARADASPALARLRARASRLAVAADRVREGRRIRGARHRASAPALAALPRSRR